MDSFEPVGFALAVVTVNDVEAWSPEDFASEISKVIYFDKIQDHQEILAYEDRIRRGRRFRLFRPELHPARI